MEYKLNYSTTRTELFIWYWKVWRAYLWKIHLILVLLLSISIGLFGFDWNITDYKIIPLSIIIFFIILLISIIYPQIMYKSSIRELKTDKSGIYTVIGKEIGTVNWNEIQKIEVVSNSIALIGKSYNAFVVPRRAFNNEEQYQQFLTAIKGWHEEGN
jgi:hypothetical protein